MVKLPSGIDINKLIDDLRGICWEAYSILSSYSKLIKGSNYENKFLKNDNINDPVTLADLKVNEIVIQRINEKYEGINWEILSEENAKLSTTIYNLDSEWMWILDPLDGTKDFIQGTGNYAMHLALNYKKEPYLGIVLIPEKNELWFAYGEKVWCEKKNGTKTQYKKSKNKYNFNEMTIVTSKNHRNKTLENLINKINFRRKIIMGSIGCKIASIVRGESDIYICLSMPGQSSPKDWDFAAPEAILKASGGAITNLDNEKLSYNKENFEQNGIIIASNNKQNHEQICLNVKEIILKYNLYPLDS